MRAGDFFQNSVAIVTCILYIGNVLDDLLSEL